MSIVLLFFVLLEKTFVYFSSFWIGNVIHNIRKKINLDINFAAKLTKENLTLLIIK